MCSLVFFFKVPKVRWVGQLTTSFEHISSSKFKWRVLHCILCLVDKISPRFGSLCSTGSSNYEVFVCASSLLDCTENEGESWRCIPLCSNLALCTRQCLVDTVAVSLFVFCWTQSGTDQSLIFFFSLPCMTTIQDNHMKTCLERMKLSLLETSCG